MSDTTIDTERLDYLFSVMPLKDFCALLGVSCPDIEPRSVAPWARDILDAEIAQDEGN